VSRCIVREIKEGRGSPHGGVYLDIAWIKQRLPNAAEHIRKKLPSMYHQFKQLADIDITQEPMEVGPTTHYIMGGVRVDGDTQMSSVPGLFAAGECAAGINGANRLGGNSLSDIIVFGKRAGEFAARFAQAHARGAIDARQVDEAARRAVEPFDRGTGGEGPFQVQYALQEMMQDLVGIVRNESEMLRALDGLDALRERARQVGIGGHREYNPGWHAALDLHNLLTVSEAITRSALDRRESRGGHFREDFPEKDADFATFNMIVRKDDAGRMGVSHAPIPEMPAELKGIIEAMK
jgi:succinate dehydrogenase / fumarate reductase flavoprotein subunit